VDSRPDAQTPKDFFAEKLFCFVCIQKPADGVVDLNGAGKTLSRTGQSLSQSVCLEIQKLSIPGLAAVAIDWKWRSEQEDGNGDNRGKLCIVRYKVFRCAPHLECGCLRLAVAFAAD